MKVQSIKEVEDISRQQYRGIFGEYKPSKEILSFEGVLSILFPLDAI